MNVLYFSNQFASRSGHGIARFSHELYKAVTALETDVKLLPVAAWSDRDKESLKELKLRTGLELIKTGRRLTPLLWSYLDLPKIETLVSGKYDALHITSLGYPISSNLPTVMTIHDIGPLSHPQFFPKKKQWIMDKSIRHAVKNVDQFVAVSEASANAFANYVKSHLAQNISQRIQVIYEGVSEDFIEFRSDPNYLPINGNKPFILAAGKLSPRKNVDGIIRALAGIKDQVPYDLITVGGDGWDMGQINDIVDSYGLQGRVHFAGYVSDHELKELYAKAEMFIYPSLFEGFGLTILEAMACGAPVITSNTSSIPEVAGDAAVLIDPTSDLELQKAILDLHENNALRLDLISKGRSRAQTLNWKDSAISYSNVYNNLIKNEKG